jgi:MYXO-CTERM domain-containing protein
VPQEPETPAQATQRADCEANCEHHRPELTTGFDFRISGQLAATRNGQTSSFMGIRDLGVGGDFVFLLNDSDGAFDFSGTMGPGKYQFQTSAGAEAFEGQSVSSSFAFQLDFSEHAGPPNGVPEPQTLGLALGGLAACGVVRRRRA